MKQITKNLISYQADIHASIDEIDRRLPQFEPIGPHQRTTWGFVEVVPESGNRVLTFAGGWVICFREDSKLLPATAVRDAVDKACAAVFEATGRKPGKKERKQIQADAIHDLLPQAFSRPRLTYVIYSARTQRLFVNTGAQRTADQVVTAIVQALESVKTSTVHVSEPAMGLTTRLSNWLDEGDSDDCFGDLYPVDEAVLASDGRKWAVKMAVSLAAAEPALRNAIQQGAKVDSLRFLLADGTRFRITQALRLTGVTHASLADPEDDHADPAHAWSAQLALEVATLDTIFDELLRLLSPEKAQADKPTDQWQAQGVVHDERAEPADDLDGLF